MGANRSQTNIQIARARLNRNGPKLDKLNNLMFELSLREIYFT